MSRKAPDSDGVSLSSMAHPELKGWARIRNSFRILWFEWVRIHFVTETVEIEVSTMRDVPRDAMGWPTVEPKFFTLPQLIREARKWSGSSPPGTTGATKWKLYTDELVRRGFSTAVEIAHKKLPDDIYGPGKLCEKYPFWWDQMKED